MSVSNSMPDEHLTSKRYQVLSLRDIGQKYKSVDSEVEVLKAVNLELMRGDFVGLSGPSGSGKSTLLNIAGLVICPSSGSLCFLGHAVDFGDTSTLRKWRRQSIGFVFQHYCLLAGLTAFENVVLSGLMAGFSNTEASDRARLLLNEVGLEERLGSFPAQLSGGEQQRVAVCRACVHEPVLVLADEPTGSLDRESAEFVLQRLWQLSQKGVCVLMASHSQRALGQCSRVVNLESGALSSRTSQ